MIANPTVPAFRYDPYDKRFTREGYDHDEMRKLRGESVKKARKTLVTAEKVEADENIDPREKELQGNDGAGGWAVVLGTLGRQGSLSVLSVSHRSGVVLPVGFPELTRSLALPADDQAIPPSIDAHPVPAPPLGTLATKARPPTHLAAVDVCADLVSAP